MCHALVVDIQLLLPAECIVSLCPVLMVFGQACKFINDTTLMQDLEWTAPITTNNSNKETTFVQSHAPGSNSMNITAPKYNYDIRQWQPEQT